MTTDIEQQTEVFLEHFRRVQAEIGKVIGLEEVPQAAADIIAARIRGRTLVDPNL